MFQPLPKYPVELIPYFLNINCRYFVTQKYPRGKDVFINENVVSLIATHYTDRGRAVDHLKSLKGEEFADIFDLSDEVDKTKFEKLLTNKDNFIVYTSATSKAKVRAALDKLYKPHMKRYVQKHTNWKIGGKDEIIPNMEIILGELFVTLKYSGYDELKIPFSDLEKA